MAKLHRAWTALIADRRKLATLSIAIGIGLLFWARLIVISDAPRTAIAEECDDGAVERAAPSDTDDPAQKAPTEQTEQGPPRVHPLPLPDLAPLVDIAGEGGKSNLQPAENAQRASRGSRRSSK